MPTMTAEQSQLADNIKNAVMGLLQADGTSVSLDIDTYDGQEEMYVRASNLFVQKSESADYERIVTGVVLEPGEPDLHGEMISEDEVFKAMENFNLYCRQTNVQHLYKSDSLVIESWQTKVDQTIQNTPIKKGTWMMSLRLPEEEFEGVLKGQFTGLSVGCLGNREPILMAKRKYEGDPTHSLTNLDFTGPGAHVAIVDSAANGHDLLIVKSEDNEVEKNELAMTPATDTGLNAGTLKMFFQSFSDLYTQFFGTPGMGDIDTTNQTNAEIVNTEPATNSTDSLNLIPQVEKSQGDTNTMKQEDIQKAINDAVETAVQSTVTKMEEAHKAEKEDLMKSLKALEEREESRKFEDFKTELNKSVSGLDEDKVQNLYEMSKSCPEAWEVVKDTMVKKEAEMDSDDSLEESGTSVDGNIHKDAEDSGLSPQVQALAKKLQSEDPSLSDAKAITKALFARKGNK